MVKFYDTYISFTVFLSKVLAREFPDVAREHISLTRLRASSLDYHPCQWVWASGALFSKYLLLRLILWSDIGLTYVISKVNYYIHCILLLYLNICCFCAVLFFFFFFFSSSSSSSFFLFVFLHNLSPFILHGKMNKWIFGDLKPITHA